MFLQICLNKGTARDDPQAFRARRLHRDGGQLGADAPAAQGLRHFGVQEDDRPGTPLVGQERGLPLDERLAK